MDLRKSKQLYNNIKVPEDLKANIDLGMKLGRRKRRIKKIAPVSSLVALLLVFAISVNTSVVFAQAVNEIPILRDMAEILTVNEGIRYSLEEGYIQNINKSVFIGGDKVTITRVIGDYSRLIIGYQIEGYNLNSDDFYTLEDFQIYNDKGNAIAGAIFTGSGDYSNEGLKPLKGERYINLSKIQDSKLPNDLILEFTGIINMDDIGYENEAENNGDNHICRVDLKLKDKIINVQPEVYELNKSVELGSKTLNIREMKVYPMSTEIVIDSKLGDNVNFGWFDNCYLEDEKGRAFALNFGTGPTGEGKYSLFFNGGAYNKSKELTLYSNGVYYNSNESRKLVVDLKNKTLLKGEEYGLQLVDIRKYSEYKCQDEFGKKGITFVYEGEKGNENIDTSEKKLISTGIEISFKGKQDFGIVNVAFDHPLSGGGGMMGINQNDPNSTIEARIYLNRGEVTQDIITIEINSYFSNKNKTEGFSVRLK